MADIQIADYRLQSDTHGWVVAEEKVRQSGESAGETYLTNARYLPNLQSALQRLLEERLRSSDAESLDELLREVKDFRAALTQFFGITVVEPGGRG